MAEAGEDLLLNLSNYKIQLQQVESALTTDPDNEDLVKLKSDLEEVIDLTQDLVNSQATSSRRPTTGFSDDEVPVAGGSRKGRGDRDVQEMRAWMNRADWKSGDKCRAQWTDPAGETQYYPATVDEILDDGSCSVIFDKYSTTEVTQLALLLPPVEIDEDDEASDSKKPKTKKDLSLAQREYKKKKAQKKAQRLKQHEDEREQDKNKWISFNAKVFSKTTKGKVKKSIFASPDCTTTTGKVGIGTCGVSGRPMTKFTHMEKWKK